MSAQPPSTCDLCDAHKGDTDGGFRVLPPLFRDFGRRLAFHGPVATVRCLDDNSMVKAAVESPGAARVLVVDGGGSQRCALVGGELGELAAKNAWAGLLVYGCVRDCDELAAQPLGVKALAAHPRKSAKGLHGGEFGRVLDFAGVRFVPGAWLYADADGIVLAPQAVHTGA